MKLRQGDFVNVVATVNLTSGQGEILYVNPTTHSIEPLGKRSDDFELVALDTKGHVLARVKPLVRIPASAPRSGPMPKETMGLIQEDIPLIEGMDAVVLMHKGKEMGRFKAGSPTGGPKVANLGPTPANQGSRRMLTTDGEQPEAGVTYTVLVKPEGSKHWNTIAVGKELPSFEIDRNQFPGAKKAIVRVLRSTGFRHTVVSEKEISLDY